VRTVDVIVSLQTGSDVTADLLVVRALHLAVSTCGLTDLGNLTPTFVVNRTVYPDVSADMWIIEAWGVLQ